MQELRQFAGRAFWYSAWKAQGRHRTTLIPRKASEPGFAGVGQASGEVILTRDAGADPWEAESAVVVVKSKREEASEFGGDQTSEIGTVLGVVGEGNWMNVALRRLARENLKLKLDSLPVKRHKHGRLCG